MSLVRSLARRYSYRGEQLEDLVQIGAIGLIKAIDRFDLDRGVELTTYATPNIIGEIKRHFRDKGWSVRVPRGLQELNVQLSRLVEQLTVQLGRSPTISELAKASDSRRKRCSRRSRAAARTRRSRSRPAAAGTADDELDPLESIGEEEHEYEVSEDRAVLEPGFRVLDERERRILHLRFFKGLTQSQIAQQVGISQMHVSRLIRRSLEKIRDEIVEEEEAEPRRAATASPRARLPPDSPTQGGEACFHPPPAVEGTPEIVQVRDELRPGVPTSPQRTRTARRAVRGGAPGGRPYTRAVETTAELRGLPAFFESKATCASRPGRWSRRPTTARRSSRRPGCSR